MTVGRAVLVLPMYAAAPQWFGEAAAAGVDVIALGPRRWLLCSDACNGAELVATWQHRLPDSAYVFEDAGDRFVCLPVRGVAATKRLSQQLLQSVDGLPGGSAVTTLLGEVPVVCHVRNDRVDVLVDRSLVHHAEEWLQQTLSGA
jgi:heterotetrameric sarcosine oxidase gamma subunit